MEIIAVKMKLSSYPGAFAAQYQTKPRILIDRAGVFGVNTGGDDPKIIWLLEGIADDEKIVTGSEAFDIKKEKPRALTSFDLNIQVRIFLFNDAVSSFDIHHGRVNIKSLTQ